MAATDKTLVTVPVNGQFPGVDTHVFTDNFLMPSADNVAGLYAHYYNQQGPDDNNNGPNDCQYQDDLSQLGSAESVYDENDEVFNEDAGQLMEQISYGSESLDLVSAAYEAVKSRRLTPLLKHELKFLIQSRRMSQGMDEMAVQFESPRSGQVTIAIKY